jgi:hypothetical protein
MLSFRLAAAGQYPAPMGKETWDAERLSPLRHRGTRLIIALVAFLALAAMFAYLAVLMSQHQGS